MDRVQIGDYLQDKQPDKPGKCKACEIEMVDNDKVDYISQLKS